MYIRTLNKQNEIIIVNFDVNASKLIRVEDNKLIFEMKDGKDNTLTLDNNENAKIALDKLFITVGMSAPFDKVMDLTNIEPMEDDTPIGITMDEIAKKFKIDVRQLSIVKVPVDNKKLKLDENEIIENSEEENDNQDNISESDDLNIDEEL